MQLQMEVTFIDATIFLGGKLLSASGIPCNIFADWWDPGICFPQKCSPPRNSLVVIMDHPGQFPKKSLKTNIKTEHHPAKRRTLKSNDII